MASTPTLLTCASMGRPKFLLMALDQPPDHVTTMIANHSGQMIRQPFPPPSIMVQLKECRGWVGKDFNNCLVKSDNQLTLSLHSLVWCILAHWMRARRRSAAGWTHLTVNSEMISEASQTDPINTSPKPLHMGLKAMKTNLHVLQ